MLLSVFVGLLLITTLVLCRVYDVFNPRIYPTDTIQRIVDSILRQSEYISSLQSPHIAIIQCRECQASLATLISVIRGGRSTIDVACGIDTERLQNILYFQEKQIYEYLYTNVT